MYGDFSATLYNKCVIFYTLNYWFSSDFTSVSSDQHSIRFLFK
jgi:hypothetical protein